MQALAAARADGRNVGIARLRGEIRDHDKMLNLLTKTSDELAGRPERPEAGGGVHGGEAALDLGDILEAIGSRPGTSALRPY